LLSPDSTTSSATFLFQGQSRSWKVRSGLESQAVEAIELPLDGSTQEKRIGCGPQAQQLGGAGHE
jgi:hypothetical protein